MGADGAGFPCRCSLRYSRGLQPVISWKSLLKLVVDWKPAAYAQSVMDILPSASRCIAFCTRMLAR